MASVCPVNLDDPDCRTVRSSQPICPRIRRAYAFGRQGVPRPSYHACPSIRCHRILNCGSDCLGDAVNNGFSLTRIDPGCPSSFFHTFVMNSPFSLRGEDILYYVDWKADPEAGDLDNGALRVERGIGNLAARKFDATVDGDIVDEYPSRCLSPWRYRSRAGGNLMSAASASFRSRPEAVGRPQLLPHCDGQSLASSVFQAEKALVGSSH